MTQIRFIAGSGRSGTTWIQDALATANKLRPVFEPLHPYVSEIGRRYAHRALSADEELAELKEFLINACAGRGPRLWTQFRQQRRWLVPPTAEFWSKRDAGRTKRHWAKFLRELPRMTAHGLREQPLVKCIRANLMLPWIARHLRCRVALVVRHPGAVVESELRGRWNASYALERFREDSRLHELTGDRYRPLLSKKLSQVESLALRWVIENQWVMEAAETNGIRVIHYENLRKPENNEWPLLCSSLGVMHVPDRAILTRPSQQSGARRSAVPLAQPERPRWMAGLSQAHADEIQRILDEAAFCGYTVSEPNPLSNGLSAAPTPQASFAQ